MNRLTRPPNVRKGPAHSRALLSVVALLGGVLLLPIVLPPADTSKYYLALLLTALTLIPVVAHVGAGTLDAFEPIIPISGLFGLSYGVRAMYIAYAPVTIEPIVRGVLPFYDYIDRALVLAIVAYCMLLFGYFVVGAVVRVKPLAAWSVAKRQWPARLDGRKIAILLALAIVGSALYRGVGAGTVTSTTTLLGMLKDMVQVCGCVLMLYVAAGDRRLSLLIATCCIALPLAAWQSVAYVSKTCFLQFIYVVVAARHYAKQRLQIAVLGVVAVVAILMIFPTIGVLRTGSAGPIVGMQRQTSSFGAQVAELGTRFSRMSPSVYAQVALEGLLSRATGIDTLSLLMKYDMSAELGNPAAYAYTPVYAFIPRLVWPSKPVLDQATRFGRLLLIASFAGARSTTAFGIAHVGDLFVSFGVPGVLIGMCLLGCLYRIIYKLFDPLNSPDLGIKFVYIMILWHMVNGFEGDIPTTYSNLLKSLVVWGALKIWLNPPAPAVQAPAPALRRPVPPNARSLPHPARSVTDAR